MYEYKNVTNSDIKIFLDPELLVVKPNRTVVLKFEYSYPGLILVEDLGHDVYNPGLQQEKLNTTYVNYATFNPVVAQLNSNDTTDIIVYNTLVAVSGSLKSDINSITGGSSPITDGNSILSSSVSGSIFRTQQERNSDFIKIKDFSAIGDGITDDTVVIQSVINEYSGYTIEFPSDKIYLISNSISISYPNTKIIGANIKMSSDPIGTMKSRCNVFVLTADNCIIDSCNIIGPDSNINYDTYDYLSTIVDIINCSENIINNCNINVVGISINAIVNRLISNHTKITNNIANGCGIVYGMSGPSNCFCSGNRITNTPSNGLNGVGDAPTTMNDNIVSDNYLENIGRMGIEDQQNTNGTRITRNIIKNTGTTSSVSGEGFGISSVGSLGSVFISQNTIVDFVTYGIECPALLSNLISENYISQERIGKLDTGLGIVVNGGKASSSIINNTISRSYMGVWLVSDFNTAYIAGNTFLNCAAKAIYADSSNDASLIVQGNTFKYDVPNNLANNDDRLGIATYSTGNVGFKHTLVQGNTFKYYPSAEGGSSSGLEFMIKPATDNFAIIENIFDGGGIASMPVVAGNGANNSGLRIIGNTFINNSRYHVGFYTNPVVSLNNIGPHDTTDNIALGFFDKQTSMSTKPTVIGSQTTGEALNSLLIGLDTLGLINNTTSSNANKTIINVKDFGAVGDGLANDTTAIQNAINSLPISGGTVFFPAGQYVVLPTIRTSDPDDTHAYDGHPIIIDKSNVSLIGDGAGTSTIIQKAYDGQSSALSWQIINSKVFRGAGVFIKGGLTEDAAIKNINIRDLTIESQGGNTRNNIFPSDITTGDGWDLTHKGVWLENDRYFSGVNIIRCEIKNFFGELIYSGSWHLMPRSTLIQNKISNSNASLLSASFQLIRDNYISNTANHAYEISVPDFGNDVDIRGNVISDAVLDGISIANFGQFQYGTVSICDNIIRNCIREGVWCAGVHNLTISKNTIIDCGTTSSAAIKLDQANGYRCDSSRVVANQILCDRINVNNGIMVLGNIVNCEVYDNNIDRTTHAVDNNITIIQGIAAEYPSNVKMYNNYINSTYCYTTQSEGIDILLDTTNRTLIARVRPTPSGFYEIHASYEVANAPTNVTIELEHYDSATNLNTTILQPLSLKSIGAYPLLIQSIRGFSANDSQYINIYATAGTANNVVVNALIKRIR